MRRKRTYKKYYSPDFKFERIDVARFINYVMQEGKKSTAERVVYNAFDIIKKETKKESMEVFSKAIENASPMLEVISRRVGGANYQIPHEVSTERKFVLACR